MVRVVVLVVEVEIVIAIVIATVMAIVIVVVLVMVISIVITAVATAIVIVLPRQDESSSYSRILALNTLQNPSPLNSSSKVLRLEHQNSLR